MEYLKKLILPWFVCDKMPLLITASASFDFSLDAPHLLPNRETLPVDVWSDPFPLPDVTYNFSHYFTFYLSAGSVEVKRSHQIGRCILRPVFNFRKNTDFGAESRLYLL